MKKLSLGISLILGLHLGADVRASSFSFVQTPEGEVASDLAANLDTMPGFSWSIDPFLKLPGYYPRPDEMMKPTFKLQATMMKSGEPSAVLNDQVVRPGDMIEGKKVIRIGVGFVLLESGGSILEVGLYEEGQAEISGKASRAPASVSGEPEIRIEEIKQ